MSTPIMRETRANGAAAAAPLREQLRSVSQVTRGGPLSELENSFNQNYGKGAFDEVKQFSNPYVSSAIKRLKNQEEQQQQQQLQQQLLDQQQQLQQQQNLQDLWGRLPPAFTISG